MTFLVLSDILISSIAFCILLMPLVFWMYIFVSFYPYGVSRLQFIFGIIIGAISTIPFIYADSIFLGDFLTQIFIHLSTLQFSIFGEGLFLSLSMFFVILWGIFFGAGFFLQKRKKTYIKVHAYSIFAFFVLLFFGVGNILLLHSSVTHSIPNTSVLFGNITFVSIGAIISYYIVVSFLEEGIKYMGTLGFSGKSDYFMFFQKYICLSACIALGFAFFENILYSVSYIQKNGIESSLLSLIFFRSVFSIILHLVSSMLFATGFWYIIHEFKNTTKSIILFFLVAFLALMSHVFFDVFLTFGYVGYIFFYIIGIYFFLSYLANTTDR